MVESNIWQIALVYTLGMLTPGPNFFLILSNGMTYGRKAGLSTALGVVLGTLFWIVLSLFGIALLIKSSPTLFIGFKLLGGGYLVYISLKKFKIIINDKKVNLPNQVKTLNGKSLGYMQQFIHGLMANVFNPKSLLFWLAIFSSLSLIDGNHLTQHALIITVVITISLTYHTSLALFASEMGQRLTSSAWSTGINLVAASVFLIFGLSILIGLLQAL